MTEVDWDKVRGLIARSLRGHPPSAEEMKVIDHAWKYRPNTYTKVHAEEKKVADAEMNPLAGGRQRDGKGS